MIQMTKRVRIEVLVDAPIAPKLAQIAEEVGITGHTLLRTTSGRGHHGSWSEDLLSGATAKYIFLAIANVDRCDRFIESIVPLLESHGLVILRSEVEVVRPERF